MKKIAIALFAFAALAAEAPKSPVIPAELRAKFWRAQAEDSVAETKAQDARKALSQALSDMQAVCGKEHVLALGADGEPACNPKPVEKPAPPAKK